MELQDKLIGLNQLSRFWKKSYEFLKNEIDLSSSNTLKDANAYADQVKSDIYGGIPNSTLDTLTELATAFEENQDVVEALDAAITNKVDKGEFETHVTESGERIGTLEANRTDWNQNDETASDYVKNRPLYIEKDAEIIPETEVFREKVTQIFPLIPYGFEVGKTYKVTYDGEEYLCEYKYHKNENCYALGDINFYSNNPEAEITGEPFCCYWYRYYGYPEIYIASNSVGTHTISIEGILEEITINIPTSNLRCYLTPNLEENVTYTINWNGTQYNLTCVKEDNYYYVGNKYLLSIMMNPDESVTDSGEDFLLTKYENGPLTLYVREEGEYVYSVEGLLPEQTIIAKGYGFVTLDSVLELAEGESFKIIFDDMEYTCIAKFDTTNTLYLGNYSNSAEEDLEDNNEPFCITNTSWGEIVTNVYIPVGNHTISIFKDVYHILDDRFLPPLVGRYGTGEFAEIFNDRNNNEASGKYSHAEGQYTVASGECSHAEGQYTVASGECSHAEGSGTVASGYNSHAEGQYTKATIGFSHAEGYETIASGGYSHAEGRSTMAMASSCHAEGARTTAYGAISHAEGAYSLSSGEHSHAEGGYLVSQNQYADIKLNITGDGVAATTYNVLTDIDEKYSVLLINNIVRGYNFANIAGRIVRCKSVNIVDGKIKSFTTDTPLSDGELVNKQIIIYLGSIASGAGSHAQGGQTVAAGDYQHTAGKFNEIDTEGKYAEIIGNGTGVFERNNIRTLDWEGNAEYQGDVKANACGGTAPISLVETAKKTVMLITATQTDDVWSVDKTFAEISEHIKNGGTVVLYDSVKDFYYSSYNVDQGISFSAVSVYGTDTIPLAFMATIIIEYNFRIFDDDTVNYRVISLNIEDLILYGLDTEAQTIVGAINEVNAEVTSLQEIVTPTALTLSSPNGTRFQITVGDDGVLTATEIA